MSVTADQIQFRPYSPDRFLSHLPFGERGYLFTVPGAFPEDTPAHTNMTDRDMAVYRVRDEWEVRDVNGKRRVWGTGPTRRIAVGLALLEIARIRRLRAADITDRRVNVLGLEAVPPYSVEVTDWATLVFTPQGIGHLKAIRFANGSQPARYHVTGFNGGRTRVIPNEGQVEMRDLIAGMLHIRCGCEPDGDYFENEAEAQGRIRQLGSWRLCPKSPGAPAEADAQPDDDLVPALAE